MDGRAVRWGRVAVPASPRTLTWGATAVAVGVTVLVSVVPSVRFAYRSVPAHAALETVDALAASMAAFLVYGRVRRRGDGGDLLLASALALLAIGDLFFALVPALVGATRSLPFATWAPLAVRLTAVTLLAIASVLPPRRASRRLRQALAGTAAALAAVVLVLWLVRSHLPLAVDPALQPRSSGYPRITGHPAALALQLVQAVPYALAAVAFTARATRTGDPLHEWLGAACAFGALARVNYFLFPSIYSQWVYTGDLLRTAFYLLLLVGAGYEIRGYWVAQAEAAVLEERRRVARDLHDGAVQEIGYVRSLAARRAKDGDRDAERMVAAAERALAEMRAALTALTVRLDEPLAETVRRAAGEVADRYDVPVEIDADESLPASAAEREAVVRIVREAVGNAVRHGRATHVRVELAGPPARRLVVRDDGTGFDPATVGDRGFGLVSMRDRAEGVGGRLVVTSAPGRGAVVEVVW
ncbi:MAG: sensor histidine kinase [Frankiaceae bacterium]